MRGGSVRGGSLCENLKLHLLHDCLPELKDECLEVNLVHNLVKFVIILLFQGPQHLR